MQWGRSFQNQGKSKFEGWRRWKTAGLAFDSDMAFAVEDKPRLYGLFEPYACCLGRKLELACTSLKSNC
jgi:hypothetical protein